MYGAGLERIVELIEDEETRGRLAADELVAGLLMIHDLYPVPLEKRVMQALDSIRPYMESHGGNIELLGFEDGVVKLRLEGSCKSCRASSSTLELAVRQALQEAAPDLLGMDVEGVVEEEMPGVPLPVVNGAPSWHTLDIAAPELLTATDVDGMSLVVANVGGTLLAYRNQCASCNSELAGGTLDQGVLACPSCGRSYFLPQAGRSMDDDHLQLQPIPLLREAEAIKVAL
jgi:Fe-S cluster biogenesis protein NfuA/nitrite reductase/ring-hydroxylating ferredoxin subunit